MTIEDPIEYHLDQVNQSQVNEKAGLTFSTGLRSFLRQDPDVMLVGEVRDTETAEISFQAALTGHLVLSTLHTNDAPSSLVRLADMKVEPFLLSSSLVGVLAQRLVRKLCPFCLTEYQPSDEVLEKDFSRLCQRLIRE
jgi:type IV pilus assembly protein PilB